MEDLLAQLFLEGELDRARLEPGKHATPVVVLAHIPSGDHPYKPVPFLLEDDHEQSPIGTRQAPVTHFVG